MSKLGNYLHATFEGYRKGGTNQVKPNRNISSNFSPSIFTEFTNDLSRYRRAISQNFSVNIQELEKKYNAARDERLFQIQQLAKNPSSPTYIALVQRILEAAKLDQTLDAEKVAKFMSIDTTTRTLKINTTEGVAGRIKGISGEKDAYITTLLARCRDGFKIIDTLQDAKIKQDLNQQLQAITNSLTKVKHQKSSEELIIADVIDTKVKRTAGNVKLPLDAAKKVIEKIRAIVSPAILGRHLAALQGGLEEVLGTMLGPHLDNFSEEIALPSLSAMLEDMPQVSIGRQSSLVGVTVSPVLKLHQKTIQSVFKADSKMIKQLPDGTLSFALEFDTANKADFIIHYEGKDIGVSSKAVDLSKPDRWDPLEQTVIPNSISLQNGTNLITYLDSANKIKSNMGNHFLNIFSVAEPETSSGLTSLYTSLQKQARVSFALYMIYNALSGEILKDQGKAQLFYIYDKSKKLPKSQASRIRFFSIGQMVSDLINQGYEAQKTAIIIDPSLEETIERMQVTNEKVPLIGDMKVGEAILARITTALAEARYLRYEIGLSAAYVKAQMH